ncbi:alpha/beta hydrolase family protein [Asticcacaulis taihuensis]|uniref:alpha/beta hydrolase family protein n=1 Tax=Asticcacaulis taihuensis TaxID=260084 RepID=UPI0026EFEA2A|nr:alpha/beta hydrolase [Asticcacaulis taihuensis]
MKKGLSLVSAILALAFAMPAFAEDPAGDWGGLLMGQLHIIVHVKKDDQGQYSATLESPDQGTFVLPADTVTAAPDHLAFAITRINGSYDGQWDETKQAWVGTWTQGQAMPLELKRLVDGKVVSAEPKRPQEEAITAGPRPYTVSEVAFDSVAGVKLAGTFSVPEGKGPLPAVVLIAGSGPQTRVENVFGHKVFLVLADALNRAGIAVLRYDKRGIGQSTGDYATATTTDFTTDAIAAVNWLKTRPEVDKAHVGLIGHSEGGLIAPAVAVNDPSVGFIVLMAGPGLPGDQILLLQQAAIARAAGQPEAAIATAEKINKAAFDMIKSAKSLDDAKTKAADLVASGQMTQAQADTAFVALATPWLYEFIHTDPRPTLEKVMVPVLAINGALDTQVSAKENLAAIKDSVKNNTDATVIEMPGLNHLFQTANTGSPSEYIQIEETMAPIALKTITDWVVAHTR